MTSDLMWTFLGAAVGAVLAPLSSRAAKIRIEMAVALPVSAALTAMLWGALAWRRADWPDLLVYSAFAALAVPLAVVDAFERRLPRPLMRALYAATLVLSAVIALSDGDGNRLLRAATGMTASLIVYLVIAMAAPGDLGAGDVRLAGVIGWVLAWHSWPALFVGLVLGTVAGALVGATLILARRIPRRGHIPAGPTMLFGALVTLIISV